jgi:hypothetical protein
MTIQLRTILFTAAAFTVHGQISKTSIEPGAPPARASAAAVSAVLSPIPLYPANGAIPAEMSDKYLFLDGATRDLVISYPASLATSDVPMAGPRTEVRVEMKTHVSPFVYVQFSPDTSGRIRYGYTIVNEARATRDIASWSIAVPHPGSNLPARAVDRASVEANTPAAVTPRGWRIATAAPDRGRVTMTWAKTGDVGVAPNAMLSGVSVSSPLLPGFVRLTFAGSSADAGVDLSAIPAAVKKALDDFEATNFNQVTVLSLGPKFPVGTNKLAIAADLLEGITVLTQHKHLRSDSPFLTEATAALRAYLNGAQDAADGPASDYVGPAVHLEQQPAAGLEAQIYQAMQLSLGK